MIYLYLRHKFSYFDRHGILGIKKNSWVFGNLNDLGKRPIYEMIHDKYIEFKGRGAIGGLYFFTEPAYLIMDPNILKDIMVKDFDYFHDRGVFVDEKNDPLSAHLFSLEGLKWKKLRAKLSPTFTSGKMKMMYSTLMNVAKEFEEYVDEQAKVRTELEWKNILSSFTIDIIGSCAFGIECMSY